MECPNCKKKPARARGSIWLLSLGEVKCDTGDCYKRICPVCRAIFYESKPTPPRRRPADVGAKIIFKIGRAAAGGGLG